VNAPFDRHHWRPGLEPTGVDGHGLGVLSDERCLQLLGSEPVGRVGFSAGSLPVVYVAPSGATTKARAACSSSLASSAS
jgi:hypothetical protein